MAINQSTYNKRFIKYRGQGHDTTNDFSVFPVVAVSDFILQLKNQKKITIKNRECSNNKLCY